MMTYYVTTQKCIVCNHSLNDHQLQQQQLYESQAIHLITCSNNCRVKYYKSKKQEQLIARAAKENNLLIIKSLRIMTILNHGFRVRIEKCQETPNF